MAKVTPGKPVGGILISLAEQQPVAGEGNGLIAVPIFDTLRLHCEVAVQMALDDPDSDDTPYEGPDEDKTETGPQNKPTSRFP